MSRRVIPQSEAHAALRALRALRAFLFRSYDRKVEEVGFRSWHLGSVELEDKSHGVYLGMSEMARGTAHGVTLLGDLAYQNGKPVVDVYAIAMPRHEEATDA